MKKPEPIQKPYADAIRDEIKKIPSERLTNVKPADLYDGLKAAGVEITNSVKSQTSKLLTAAKKQALSQSSGQDFAASGSDDSLRAATLKFVEICGSIETAKAEIAKFEQFIRKISPGH